MSPPLLARPCPACDLAYGEHTLDALAACIEALLGLDDPPSTAGFLMDPWLVRSARPCETVTGPTIGLVL